MTEQPKALRLADALRDCVSYDEAEIENELRRLHVENERLAAEVANRNRRALANIDPRSLMSWQEGYAAGAAAEREACAKVVADESGRWAIPVTVADYKEMWAECAAAIRARGETK